MAPPPAPPAASAATFAFQDFVRALDASLSRDINALAAVERMMAEGRPNGRDTGLGYARDDLRLTVDRLTELRATLAALAPHEAEVHAILARAA
ncbi:hypothetical protein [Methylobacterium frigidaeris]|uniref:Uncharacterized protein n=1 Tax=Methylobacterium frigidaeris TaxID=2038277 RepID=A0AA37HFM0_9HYPH|nr:hypothetical protein [Methylobacterium frigidaeris]PIK74592.1 hypothetical protein CS379_01710 [Methylobacterium frigidaeris]GJD65157.1 hypothetical protein MPEAHAMD_5344 [Methylobacterium frigidaeris]